MISRDMEYRLVELLYEKKMTISTAESCTGGLIAGAVINVPGASAVYNEGFITYSNAAKEKYLGVKKETLEKYGAVSKETVVEMAQGCASAAKADVALVSSGIAGPEGGTKEKPVGLVYIGCYVRGNIRTVKNVFSGTRQEVRKQTVEAAIKLAVDMIE